MKLLPRITFYMHDQWNPIKKGMGVWVTGVIFSKKGDGILVRRLQALNGQELDVTGGGYQLNKLLVRKITDPEYVSWEMQIRVIIGESRFLKTPIYGFKSVQWCGYVYRYPTRRAALWALNSCYPNLSKDDKRVISVNKPANMKGS